MPNLPSKERPVPEPALDPTPAHDHLFLQLERELASLPRPHLGMDVPEEVLH